eukprot:GFUD01012993.1.p1 GENE.GFUD01012993.1~~GFUD01012993.1.p1  ORF type:complete len:340 (+),score=109.98 GFUD01012993.1:39-1058(+)
MPRGETRVFLGNLPPEVRVRDIEEFFDKCGKVRNVLIKHGKYGFAEFDDSRDAEDAVYDLHGKRLMGSRITVELAKGPKGGKEARRAPWVAKYGAPQRTKYRMKVQNLSSRISWQDLKDTLRKAGEVTFAEAHTDRRNEGRVELATMEDLERVFKRYQGYEMNGRKIELIKDCKKSKSRSREKENSKSRSRSRRSGSNRSRSKSKKSHSKSKRSRSMSDRSGSRDKSESGSPAKKVDLEDKDVKRLRKRSHSKDSKRSASRSSKRSPSKKGDRSQSRSSKSSAKNVKRSHSRVERSTSRASESRNGSIQEDNVDLNIRESPDAKRIKENVVEDPDSDLK